MVDLVSVKQNMCMNPWFLHLQKLGLELKCPLCLNLFKRPILLPCDHIFCLSCVPRAAALNVLECPVCKSKCENQDLRRVPFMENIATIFRSLDAAFITSLPQSPCTDAGRLVKKDSTSTIMDSNGKFGGGSSGQSMYPIMETTTKPAQASMNYSAEDERGKEDTQNPNSMRPGSQTILGEFHAHRALELEMNQAEQLLPGSPPSFGDMKCSDNDSDQSPENYQSDTQGKGNYDEGRRIEKRDRSDSGAEEGYLKDPKRQKKLNYGPLETYVKSDGHVQLSSQSQGLAVSSSELKLRLEVPSAGSQLPAITDDAFADKTTCEFCQSSKILEATGPMLHFANGKQVEEDKASCLNVIHVHSACIEWAPQVYYVGETVKNLKAELARGSKLKCSRCGLKGAALGCYVKSCRRSYHFPCAQGISKCRWDYENFLLLCPAHSSVKFPNEKSGTSSKKNATPPETTPQEPSFWLASPDQAKKLVLCGSALSSEEKFLLVKFASMIGATVSKFWKPNVTHVIAATDAKGACTRTLKVLMAISNGRWILTTDWIKACMENMRLVDEEPYEVNHDNHGCCDGPKNGRIRAVENAPKLFHGLSFYFSGDFASSYEEDLQSLVIAAGGIVFKSREELVPQNCDELAACATTLVVYNLDPPLGSKLGEEVSIIWQRLNEAEDLASKIGGQVIGHTWLLESIAAYKLRRLVN